MSWASLAGQREAERRLAAALDAARLHHALLFAGPDGVGKFTAGKLLAQAALCTGPRVGAEPCGRCSSCVKITTAGHADVLTLEPDEKDSIKVDPVRHATQALHLKPVEGRSRFLLIRDADRMTEQAQNALLKTLEEPPGSAHLVLTTSRPQAILPTVLSRCQRVPFRPVPNEAIADLLVKNRSLEPALAQLVAALAQGAPGRALEADPEAIVAVRDRAAEIDRKLEPGPPERARDAIAIAESMVKDADAAPLDRQLELLAVWLRDQISLASGAGVDVANADRIRELTELAESRGIYEILRRARTLEQCRVDLAEPYNLNPQLLVERLCLGLIGWGGSTSS
jgi:DNA polymerase III subunit delta'